MKQARLGQRRSRMGPRKPAWMIRSFEGARLQSTSRKLIALARDALASVTAAIDRAERNDAAPAVETATPMDNVSIQK